MWASSPRERTCWERCGQSPAFSNSNIYRWRDEKEPRKQEKHRKRQCPGEEGSAVPKASARSRHMSPENIHRKKQHGVHRKHSPALPANKQGLSGTTAELAGRSRRRGHPDPSPDTALKKSDCEEVRDRIASREAAGWRGNMEET